MSAYPRYLPYPLRRVRIHEADPVMADLKRYLDQEERQQAFADAIGDKLDQLVEDPAYVSYAWDCDKEIQARLDAAVLAAIKADPKLLAAYRAKLAPVAEELVIKEAETALEKQEALIEDFHWDH